MAASEPVREAPPPKLEPAQDEPLPEVEEETVPIVRRVVPPLGGAMPDKGIPDPVDVVGEPSREQMAPSRPSLPQYVAGIPLGARFDPRMCRELASDASHPDLIGCSPAPVLLPDMNPTVAIEVIGETIVGVTLFFARDPAPMLNRKYGQPEYWQLAGKGKRVSGGGKRDATFWRLSDGGIMLNRSQGEFAVYYTARSLKESIEAANY